VLISPPGRWRGLSARTHGKVPIELDWSPRDVDELFRKAANAIAHAEAIGRLIEMRRRERERGERLGLWDVGDSGGAAGEHEEILRFGYCPPPR
jgi:hypothetical protein